MCDPQTNLDQIGLSSILHTLVLHLNRNYLNLIVTSDRDVYTIVQRCRYVGGGGRLKEL